MKTKNLFLPPVLIVAISLLPAGRVTAQTFTTLYSFTARDPFTRTNSDGASPHARLKLSGNTLYGTAHNGGNAGVGAVFAVDTDGTGFTNLHSFTAPVFQFSGTNSDGTYPEAGLVLSGNTLYGTARIGGSAENGTIFSLHTNGTGFTNLHSFTATPGPDFTNQDGVGPSELFLSGDTLYGTASGGGSSGGGTVYKLNTNGTGFTTLHSFTARDPFTGTNSDGAIPAAGLILSGNTLYGTAAYGGSSGNGTVFAFNTDGTGFTTLHSFTAMPPFPGPFTNSDGAHPQAGLILSGNALYGTATDGGRSGNGTVFAVNTDGTGFTNLHSFAGYPSDGESPYAALVLSGNALYGTTAYGGASGNGTVFGVRTDGTGFTNLYNFTADSGTYPATTNSDGALPAGLVLSDNMLYGTAFSAGSSSGGTVFSLSFRPQPTITVSGTNVILSWPTNVAGFDYTGFTLQSTTNLVSAAVWTTNSPAPVVINGQNTVTNLLSGAQQFFRLIQ